MRPYVPSGHAMARSVLTMFLPRAGMMQSCAAERSYPAASAEPRTGSVAKSLSLPVNAHSMVMSRVRKS